MAMSGRRILVVGPSWVGDMVMAHSLFQLLKKRNPGGVIDVLAPAWSRPLLERMPEVRRAIDMPVGHGELNIGARWKLGRSLKDQYDQAIVLPNSLKSALLPLFAGIETRTGWRGEMRFGLINDIRLLDTRRYPLMVQRFNALAFPDDFRKPVPAPFPALQVDQEALSATLQKFDLHTTRPVLALCPGAEFGEAKRWPSEHYAAVAEARIRMGWQVWLFGSEKDREIAGQIRAAVDPALQDALFNLCGDTSLAEAIDLMSCATAVVSNDSGLMHVAAALQRPLVAVYGSTSPKFTPPLTERVAIVRLELDCSPCFERTCRYGHYHCLTQLMPAQVLDALENVLSEDSPPDTIQLVSSDPADD